MKFSYLIGFSCDFFNLLLILLLVFLKIYWKVKYISCLKVILRSNFFWYFYPFLFKKIAWSLKREDDLVFLYGMCFASINTVFANYGPGNYAQKQKSSKQSSGIPNDCSMYRWDRIFNIWWLYSVCTEPKQAWNFTGPSFNCIVHL